MIKWTTPTLKCNIPIEIEFDYILFTLEQGSKIIEKTIESDNVIDGAFYITLSQEETGLFEKGSVVNAQLNIMKDETRLATNIVQMQITRNLHNEEIE